MLQPPNYKDYIGDGVWISFDGYHIILTTERSDVTHWIGLEPEVFERLKSYRENLEQTLKNK